MTKFEVIRKHGITHSVGVANSFLKFNNTEVKGKDYFVVVKNTNEIISLLEDYGFGMDSVKNRNKALGRAKPIALDFTLHESDVEIFKTIEDEYHIVTKTLDGRVYELNQKSLVKEIASV